MFDSVFDRNGIIFRSTVAACVLSALFLIWSHRFLPISDYPDWMFEGSIVAELIHGKAPASYSFKHYPVPYAATVALLGLLDLVFPAEVSGKIVLSLCIILFALSSTYLLKSLRPDTKSPLLLLPPLFLLNTYFFWGELAYLFSLSFFFLYCGYLFRRVYQSKPINWWMVCGASIAMFFCHFLPYAAAILVTLTFLLAESRTSLIRRFLISFAPSLGLTIWYAIERSSLKQLSAMWEFWTLHQFAGRWIAAFSPFPEFLPWLGIQAPEMKIFAVLNLLVAIAVALTLPLCLAWARTRHQYAGVLASAVVCGIAVVACGYEFEGMVSPGERFLYPAVWIALCWLVGAQLPADDSPVNRGLTLSFIGLLACQAVFMQTDVAAVSTELAAVYAKLSSATSQADFCATYDTYLRQSWDEPHRKGLDVLLTNHASAPRLPYYLYVERKTEAPIFSIGILNYSGDGDNEDLCRSP